MLCAAALSTLLMGPRGYAQGLRIVSPVSGDVVSEGQPLKIVVEADDSVRMVYVLGGPYPLPDAHPIGNNVFEMDIPKTLPLGKYQVTAMGVTTTDVYSPPVEIQVEREDMPVALKVSSPGTRAGVPFPLIQDGYPFPIFVQAEFADGSKLDVTHSMKITFESKDPAVATVNEQPGMVGHGPGETTIVVGYAGQLYTTIMVAGPRPKPKGPAPEIESVTPETGVPGVTAITIRGRHFGESQAAGYVCIGTQNGFVKSWSDNEIVATVPERTHQGTIYVEQGGLNSNVIKFVPIGLFIDAISGRPTPGNQIHIQGSGFESEQGSGYVTIADIKAQVVQWSSTKIIVTVPDFSPTAWTFQLAVHQNGKSAEFRLISPQKSAAGPGTPRDARFLPSNHDTEHAGSNFGVSPYSTTQKNSFATHPDFSIEAVLGAVMPGKRIRITGSGFTSEQGTGFVTVAGVKAEVVTWTTKEIAVIVPQFTAVTRMATISVHQDNASEDFPVILPSELLLQQK